MDFTVLENINDYEESIVRKGGSLEVIGLDSHLTQSLHPLAIRKINPFSNIIDNKNNKRHSIYNDISKNLQWDLLDSMESNCRAIDDFKFFNTFIAI